MIKSAHAILAAVALHTVSGQEIVAGLGDIQRIQVEIGLVARAIESRKAWGEILGAQARRLRPRVEAPLEQVP